MKVIKKIFRLIFKIIKWFFIIIVLLAVFSAAYNQTLPTKSKTTEQLSSDEKAYIGEAVNLQKTLGNEVYPGWSDVQIPVIVYNEKYAFLIGYPGNPPAGWFKMPSEEFRGTKWETVENDDIFGETYYRQALPNPDITPENFTVKVGDFWVLTMQTKEYSAIAFYENFKKELPPVLNAVFPYKMFWNLLMGKAENYVGGMTHEAFHAFQGNKSPARLAASENISHLSSEYPWEEPQNATNWIEEANLLLAAFQSESNQEAKQLVARFLEKRDERRANPTLSEELVLYEQKREWLEGLAKYAELKLGVYAGENKGYSPIPAIEKTPDFKNYKNRSNYFNQQAEEAIRRAARPGESRFYYVGMLQAALLDRLMPEWKNTAFNSGVYLDELLKKSM